VRNDSTARLFEDRTMLSRAEVIGSVTVRDESGAARGPAYSAPVAARMPTPPGSIEGSQPSPPRAVKTQRLRRVPGAALTAASRAASAPAIGAGGGSSQSSDETDDSATVRQGGAVSREANEAIELETVAHWWCRRCGRWEVCDDADLCIECRYMVAGQRRCRPRRPRPLDGEGASGRAQS
jgi:hypothetical protein